MYRIALKMLIEDRAKFIGIVLSLSFSALIITQQAAIFTGIMQRTYGTITDTPQPDIWVCDPNVQMIDDIQPLRDIDLYRVRSIEGVEWAVPYFKGLIQARLPNGQIQTCIFIGVDDETLIGGPPKMVEGCVEFLRGPDAVIVDTVGAGDKLAIDQGPKKPKIPLRVGDTMELIDNRAVVVGLCEITRTFQSQPVIYTLYSRAVNYAPQQRKLLSFILVKAAQGFDQNALCKKISDATQFAAYTTEQFKGLTNDYYLKNTGIPINFGIAVLLGLLIGAAISGQIFYNFTTDNLRYFALFSVMGASRWLLAKMTLVQALWVAILGWGIGTGISALIGFLSRSTELAFSLNWSLFFGSGVIIFLICFIASLFSISTIYRIELGNVFK